MPFHREWDPNTGEYVINRDRTGSPPPPETGTTVQDDGTVIVANQNISPTVPPATPVQVNFPGPNEPIVSRNGTVSPRWWRFFDELYRRTGGVNDNINRYPAALRVQPTSSTVALVLTGAAPTVEIDHYRDVGKASAVLTGITIEDVDNGPP